MFAGGWYGAATCPPATVRARTASRGFLDVPPKAQTRDRQIGCFEAKSLHASKDTTNRETEGSEGTSGNLRPCRHRVRTRLQKELLQLNQKPKQLHQNSGQGQSGPSSEDRSDRRAHERMLSAQVTGKCKGKHLRSHLTPRTAAVNKTGKAAARTWRRGPWVLLADGPGGTDGRGRCGERGSSSEGQCGRPGGPAAPLWVHTQA